MIFSSAMSGSCGGKRDSFTDQDGWARRVERSSLLVAVGGALAVVEEEESRDDGNGLVRGETL